MKDIIPATATMENITDSSLHSVGVTNLLLTTGEGVVAVFLNMTYIVVFCIRPPLRNQTNRLNVGLALSSTELTVGIIMHYMMGWYKPSEMDWLLVISYFFYNQVCIRDFPIKVVERIH